MLLFALNLVTLLMQIQYRNTDAGRISVVICFKFSNFAYANTVSKAQQSKFVQLLFALNLVTLLMQIQYFFDWDRSRAGVIGFKVSNFAYANTVAM